MRGFKKLYGKDYGDKQVPEESADALVGGYAYALHAGGKRGDCPVRSYPIQDHAEQDDPVVSNMLRLLVDNIEAFATDKAVDAGEFKAWLEKVNAEGFRPEDRMNHIWEEDKLPVERVLFWEDLNVNLADIKQ